MNARAAVTAYVALGSNLGDRVAFLRAARAALAARADVAIEASSPVFETDPVTADQQPLYLNAVLRLRTSLAPEALLAACLDVERTLGRERPPGVFEAPRVIDIDVLLVGDARVDGPVAVIPHPRLEDRPFVRIPLAAVAEPGLAHPVTAAALDRASPHPGVRLFAASGW